MSDLRELFEELARTPAPPPALVGDEVFTAGRRRYRRRRRARAALTAALAVLALGTGLSLAARPEPATLPPDVALADTRPDPRPGVTGDRAVIQWIGAPDAMHVYLSYPSCAGPTCKVRYDLVGSDDGGRTWSTRAIGIKIIPRQVLPSGTLLGRAVDSTGEYLSSTDGGRTWHAITPRPGSAAVVPPGGGLVCWPQPTCELFTVDAGGENLLRLANRPPGFVTRGVVAVFESRIWLIGVDTLARRPAAATSVDGGATWAVHPLTDLPVCDSEWCDLPALDVNARGTAVAMFFDSLSGSYQVFRRVGDDWARLDASALAGFAVWSYVAADGTHVVAADDGGRRRFWAAAPTADRYTPLELAGLPSRVSPVQLEPDGRYYTALADDASQLFRSADGLVWSTVITS